MRNDMKRGIVFTTAAQPGTMLTFAPETLAGLTGRIALTPEQDAAFRAIAARNQGTVPIMAEEFTALARGDVKSVVEFAGKQDSNLRALLL
jgi:hypothetical protein